jgi:heme oxygenase (mycobilin-producing)
LRKSPRAATSHDRKPIAREGAGDELRVFLGRGFRSLWRVSVAKINAITVPRERFAEFERRFASRAGRVSEAPGFEAFELLRPKDDREVCLVLTRWRSEEDFKTWLASSDFTAGHAHHREGGPVGTASELWPFDVLEREEPAAGG